MTDQPTTQQTEPINCFDCLTSDTNMGRPWPEILDMCRACPDSHTFVIPAPTCQFCGSTRLTVHTTGGMSLTGGALDDDLTDHLVCRECGREQGQA